MILTYKYRIKDSSACKRLEHHARAVNFVWNYCCATQRKAESNWKAGMASRWPSHFTLTKLCGGVSTELGIGSDTIGEICRQFTASRSAIKHAPRFRASRGPKRALGWIPFKGRAVTVERGILICYRQKYRFWQSRELAGKIRTGSFVQDARGRWYVTFQCEVGAIAEPAAGMVGIDLGLKTLATCSNGETVPALQHYRKYERALGMAQRAGNRRRVRAINAKIANTRRDQMHKATTKIARENKLIVVGNVNSSKLSKTKMAKSVLDAGWTMFRNQLRYKSSRNGAVFIEADERFTSVTCSECGSLSGPKGQKGLRIRRWECADCGTSHDRDVNAARNILRVGLECQPPAVGIAS
jgi:putative transposase